MLDIDAVNFLFEERQDLKARGEFAKALSNSGGWSGDCLYQILLNRHLLPYWSLIRATNPSLPKISDKSFSGKDLSGVNLSGLNFSSCRFLNARLEGCTLHGTTFSGCSFTNAVLSGTSWSKARAYKCDFRRANVTGANFSGLIFRKCKMPAHLPGHRSHARKGQLSNQSGDKSFPGQVRVFSIEPGNIRDCFKGIGECLHFVIDQSGDLAVEAALVSGSTPSTRSEYISVNLSTLVPGVVKVIVGGDFSKRASRDLFTGLFSGAKIPLKVFFVDYPEEQCDPAEGFIYLQYKDTP